MTDLVKKVRNKLQSKNIKVYTYLKSRYHYPENYHSYSFQTNLRLSLRKELLIKLQKYKPDF